MTTVTQAANTQTVEILEATPELMNTFENYGLTWLVYIGLTVLMVGIIWYAIRNWHFIIKWFFSSVILAGALTPAQPVETSTTYSPLVLNSVVALFDGDQTAFMSGLKTILLVWAIIFVLGVVAWFIVKKLRANKETPQKMDTEAVMATPVEPTLADDDANGSAQ